MHMVFTPVSRPLLPVVGDASGVFPPRRVYCVGRNYAAHAREMGATERADPVFFTKSAECILPCHDRQDPDVMLYPPMTSDLHHEVELVVGLAHPLNNANPDEAVDAIYGYAVGLDMTRRDLQTAAKDKGMPWDMGKNFSESAIIAPMLPASEISIEKLMKGRIALHVNGGLRQEGHLADMIWNVGEILAELSRYDSLEAGDLIFTGTPAGVAAVNPGDLLVATIDNLPRLHVKIGDAPGAGAAGGA